MTQRRIYQDEFPYFITTKTKEGIWFFDQTRYARLLSNIIFKACQLKKYILYAYCIMPDHLHLLVKQMIQNFTQALVSTPAIGIYNDPIAPTERCVGVGSGNRPLSNPAQVSAPAVGDEKYNISELMYTIKSYFIKELRKKYDIRYSIWQIRFNTRIVDTEERLINTIEYIKSNPEKAGLPEKYHRFPYMFFNKKEILGLF